MQYNISEEDNDKRLDIFLVEQMGAPRAKVQKYIADGWVTVNGKLPKKSGDRVKAGGVVVFEEKDEEKTEASESLEVPATLPVVVLAETPEYLVINKPAGLLVHPTEAKEMGTLAHWLVERYPEIQGVGESPERPGIVHRLDREASGLMVIARTQAMFDHLKQQFQERTIDKWYTVLVHEVVEKDIGVVDFDIDRGRDGRMVSRPKIDAMKVANVPKIQPGKEALTEFVVEKRFTRFTLLKVKIHTGRTHQIRVHMYAFNHSVVGDEIYFNPKLNRKRDKDLGRLFLHATKLCFDSLTDERVCFESTLPENLQAFLGELQ